MYASNAYSHLEKITPAPEPTDLQFYALIGYFRESILEEIHFSERLQRHRKPVEYLNSVLRELHDHHQQMDRRPEMIHIDDKSYGYVTSHIKWLWEEDRSLRSLYDTTREYCRIYEKPFSIIAVHIAEYPAISKLASRVQRMIFKKKTVTTTGFGM
jgi:hypothetical protein